MTTFSSAYRLFGRLKYCGEAIAASNNFPIIFLAAKRPEAVVIVFQLQ